MSLVSVVVPTFNSGPHLTQTLASVLAQTHRDLELIVVDDGSSDGTPDVVRALARTDDRVRLFEQANARVCRARNRGIAEARGIGRAHV